MPSGSFRSAGTDGRWPTLSFAHTRFHLPGVLKTLRANGMGPAGSRQRNDPPSVIPKWPHVMVARGELFCGKNTEAPGTGPGAWTIIAPSPSRSHWGRGWRDAVRPGIAAATSLRKTSSALPCMRVDRSCTYNACSSWRGFPCGHSTIAIGTFQRGDPTTAATCTGAARTRHPSKHIPAAYPHAARALTTPRTNAIDHAPSPLHRHRA